MILATVDNACTGEMQLDSSRDTGASCSEYNVCVLGWAGRVGVSCKVGVLGKIGVSGKVGASSITSPGLGL